jgi:diguanylate cyclase (GGDEF)-like protein
MSMATVQEKTSTDPLESLVEDVSAIPSPPAIAVRIVQEVKKDNTSLNDLARIISCDPALTAKILKVANSPFYGLPSKVESIERAVNVLGLEALKNIALSFIIVKEFNTDSSGKFDSGLFWRRSITAAVGAGLIASRMGIRKEGIFVTPLLMDIGVLIMYMCRPRDYLKVIDEKRVSGAKTAEAERMIFGTDHQAVGGAVLARWGIPEDISVPVSFHHDMAECPPEYRELVRIMELADVASSIYHGNRGMEKFGVLRQMMMDEMSLDENALEDLIDSIGNETLEVLSSFEIDAGNMKPFSQILQEANEELGKLNLSYEQLVYELKQEKQKVEELAKELKEANDILRGLAFKDGLTGLFNHRYFQEHMEKEVQRADRYKRTLSLIMIDIDHFKKVNDTYGHPVGDIVIRSIANLFEETIRKCDTAARYGGEEFALILPETDVKGAVILAERLRKMAEQMEIEADGKKIKVTISIGVAMYDPSSKRRSKAEIIDAADKALYNSKQTGRNKLSIAA